MTEEELHEEIVLLDYIDRQGTRQKELDKNSAWRKRDNQRYANSAKYREEQRARNKKSYQAHPQRRIWDKTRLKAYRQERKIAAINYFSDGKNVCACWFQVLCFNCNWGKHKNKGICPHKIIKK